MASASSWWKELLMREESHDPEAVMISFTLAKFPKTLGEEILKHPSLGNQRSW